MIYINIVGGLGNQLFQIASAYAYAKDKGTLQIIDNYSDIRPRYWHSILKKCVPYLTNTSIDSIDQWYEDYPTMYKEIGPYSHDIVLNGYLQSSKYFNHCKEEIKELFAYDINELKQKYKFLLDNSERVVVIHARRTDYITYKEIHGPLDSNYYKAAFNIMLTKVENPIFILSSDDNEFWKEIKNEMDVSTYAHMILNDTDVNTFYFLQQFNNFIMSNSTFIWWIVWLSNANHAIVPSTWFVPQVPAIYDDIYEENWIRI